MKKWLLVVITAMMLAVLPGAGVVQADSAIVPPSGMVSWWPGDGNAEDFWDSNHATTVNGTTFVAGKVGQGFKFDGNDYIRVGSYPYDNPSLHPANLTVEAWIYIDQLPSGGNIAEIIAKYDCDSPTHGYELRVEGSALVLVLGSSSSWHTVSSGAALQAGQWYHVAGTYDGSKIKVYINGQEKGSTSWSGTINPSQSPLDIGGHFEPHWNPGTLLRTFNGIIDEVALYSRALSLGEIQAIYDAGTAGKWKDKTAPVTEATISPEANEAGWNNTDVTVTLTATDGGGSGVKETRYRVDGGAWQTGTEIAITTDGDLSIEYYSVDNCSNTEEAKATQVKLDKTPPVITIDSPQATTYLATETLTLEFSADDMGSGLESLEAQLDGNTVSSGDSINLSSMEGDYTLTVTAIDMAGNSASEEVTFTVGSAHRFKTAAIDKLHAAMTGDEKTDKFILRIIAAINDSLAEDLWVDGSHLVFNGRSHGLDELSKRFDKSGKTFGHDDFDTDGHFDKLFPRGKTSGITVFHREKAAAELMENIIRQSEDATHEHEQHGDRDQGKHGHHGHGDTPDMTALVPVFEEVLADLVQADTILAQVALADAVNTPVAGKMAKIVAHEIKLAEQDLARAQENAADARFAASISRCGSSWLHSQLAMKFASMNMKPKR